MQLLVKANVCERERVNRGGGEINHNFTQLLVVKQSAAKISFTLFVEQQRIRQTVQLS